MLSLLQTHRRPGRSEISELALVFFKLGTTAFGGPAAHIAMMEDEVVRRRNWLTRERFLDYVAATNLIPGPNSTELAIHVGHARAGWPGLVVAGLAFIIPATVIVGAAAWAYVRYGALPEAAGLLYGIKPVMIAIVVQALWSLGRAAIKTVALAWLGLAAVAASAAGAHELAVLGVAGTIMAAARVTRADARGARLSLLAGMASLSSGGVAAMALTPSVVPFGLFQLFAVFAKAGAVLFGSGYVLLAFLRADLVERLRWLTEAQLLDAIAIGQVTPGPVFTTATFIGYILAGTPGAIVATVGIFLPAFIFVAVSGPVVPRLRQSRVAGAALDGIIVASLALMMTVTWQLARAALVDAVTVALAGVSLLALVTFRVNSAWLICAGGALGWFIR
ncbi:MAG: chromate transporter [Gemmatimonadetes bacterium RIFCSPLOWO2_12_FULL_68_9]|nr:MAG: chromate transporter [Gemmatimonadetes bacterium RIFCSPLOWO2_12_FULL_68_9]